MKRRITIAATLVAVFVCVAATYAWARTQDSSTLRACVAENGQLQLVADGATCKSKERLVTWNVTGPAGPAGLAGVNGRDGRDGLQGPQGVAGPAGAAGSSVSSPNAIQGNFTATGITGDGPNGSILLNGVSTAVVSPRDAASGQATGKRMHKPFVITKELDKSTPLLLQAIFTNRNIPTATFNFTRGTSTTPFMTVKLTNLQVSSRVQTGDTEEIQFTYQRIEWTWVDGGITAADDWEAPVS